MDWSKGFSSRYYVSIVDPATWKDLETLQITGGSINKSDDSLQESADLSFIDYDQSAERWLRVWMDIRQDRDAARFPIFTGLASSPSKEIDGVYIKNSVQCYSVLKPADDILLRRGWHVSPGSNSGEVLQELLSVTPAPFICDDDSPDLQSYIIAEDRESNLSMAQKILSTVNWRLLIYGDGSIRMAPYASEFVETFDSISNDILETSLSVTNDWYSCPNVFRAVSDDIYYVARDTDENSPMSIQNRGREIWIEETSCDLYYGESIEQYAERRLREEQQSVYSVSYRRRFQPDIFVSDLVQIHYPAQNISGVFYIKSQTIDLSYGATVSEEVDRV